MSYSPCPYNIYPKSPENAAVKANIWFDVSGSSYPNLNMM